ncbi:MAG TPA: metal ABC transporter permease [bacterium]|nr:metal ABC transporter permease [bacterium]
MSGLYELMSSLLPFAWAEPMFMKRALIAVLLVAPACAAMGVMVVNFRMAFFSDAISHSAFTGVALGVLFGIDPLYTLIGFGVLVGLAIVSVRQRSTLSVDTVIGVFFSFAVALGIVIISARKSLTRDLQTYLYGDVLSVTGHEIIGMLILLIVCAAFLALFFNDLFLIGINERLAKAHGINVRFLEYAYALLLSLVVTVSIRVIGLLLVTAMLVVPAAAGRNLARSVRSMFWASIIIGLVSAVSGLISSFYFDSATGATIILCAAALFLMSQVWAAVRGQ